MKWVAHMLAAAWLTVVGLVVTFGFILGAAAPFTTVIDLLVGAVEFMCIFAIVGSPALLWFGYHMYKDYR